MRGKRLTIDQTKVKLRPSKTHEVLKATYLRPKRRMTVAQRQRMERESPTLVAMPSGLFSGGELERLMTRAKEVRW